MRNRKLKGLSRDLMSLPFDQKVEIILKLQKISIELNESMKRKYAKGISLYPQKPEVELSAFIRVDPQKVMVKEKMVKK